MGSNIGSVEVLISKAKFQPHIAVAIAEAIDMAITAAKLVTTAELDARLAVLEARLRAEIQEVKTHIQEVKADLVRWVLLVMLGNVALGAGATAIVNALQHYH